MTIAPKRTAVTSSSSPSLHWERRAWSSGKVVVAGVDEVGRGAWAGPLVAAAVVLPSNPHQRGRITRSLNRVGARVRDSKLLSPGQRQDVVNAIVDLDIPTSVVEIPAWEIDDLGLGQANQIALRRAVDGLARPPCHVLVDCYQVPEMSCTHESIVRGDRVSFSIALASIVAKLHRDTLMERLDDEYPGFEFSLHKGYGTALHRDRLLRLGPTPHHRRSFAPIAKMIADDSS